MNTHPTLGIDLDVWSVTYYTATVELRNKTTGRLVVVPVPYEPQTAQWWRDQAAKATA